jgi:haloacetate dehalogenase
VVSHDRGARVARRLALDHPGAVTRLAGLDNVPTATIYDSLDKERATTVWCYFFMIQPPNLPELLIGARPDAYLHWTRGNGAAHVRRDFPQRPRPEVHRLSRAREAAGKRQVRQPMKRARRLAATTRD